ncbi:uncharacterized protein LOC135394058 isoform X2 [Ornithodoros turicata]|uniref:uncharacterized protein LOC135394058 isoform X2 n=1 Tax=Ornithodoros turicata TaxID=34597 RepID=UPI0031389F51
MSLKDLAYMGRKVTWRPQLFAGYNLSNDSDAWNRKGQETLRRQDDDSLLSGWYDVISWFLNFILANPRDALFLRQFGGGVDMIEIMDKYFTYEPKVFVMYVTGFAYSILGLFGSVAYIQLRRRKRCGGDRTQDLTENMRCLLSVYTGIYILLLAGILMGSLLMMGSLFEMSRAIKSEGQVGFEARIDEVGLYIKNASKHTQELNNMRKHFFDDLTNTLLQNFQPEMSKFLLPIVQGYTENFTSPTHPRALLRALDIPKDLQENFTQLISERINEQYNATIVEAGHLSHSASSLLIRFNAFLQADANHTIRSMGAIPRRVQDADSWKVLDTLQNKSVYYVVVVLIAFIILFTMYTGAFITGMFHHNEFLAPTKRSNYSNFAGLVMVGAIAISFPVCALLMVMTTVIMVLSVTLTNYVCLPYDKIVYGEADEPIQQVSLLDDTFSVFWPEQERGKWFGKFLAGTTLWKCNGGRLFDVIHNDFDTGIHSFINKTENLHHLLSSLAVDPRRILDDPSPYIAQQDFDILKAMMWGHLENIVERFGDEKVQQIRSRDLDMDVVNPPCFAAYKGYERGFRYACHGLIRNINAFWTALGFCVWMFTILAIVSHNLSKYFLRMVNYTFDGSEVESTSSSSTAPGEATAETKSEEKVPLVPEPAPASTGEKAALSPESPEPGGPPRKQSEDVVKKEVKKEAEPTAMPKWMQKARKKSTAAMNASSSRIRE